MHAFLIVGQDNEKLKNKIEELSKKLNAKIWEYPLVKIEDVRNLNNLIRLEFNEPTLIVCKNIHEIGEEALNAFLKNLEEPQPNIYFALTAPSVRKVLPTIVSRCQIVKSVNSQQSTVNSQEIIQFLEMSTGQRLAFFDKIKDRKETINFVENIIYFLHEKKDFTNMEILLKTLTRLKANGNVNLQLTNLITQYA